MGKKYKRNGDKKKGMYMDEDLFIRIGGWDEGGMRKRRGEKK